MPYIYTIYIFYIYIYIYISRFNVRFLIKKMMSGTSLMAYEDTSRSTQIRPANSFTIEKGSNTCMVKNPERQPDHF